MLRDTLVHVTDRSRTLAKLRIGGRRGRYNEGVLSALLLAQVSTDPFMLLEEGKFLPALTEGERLAKAEGDPRGLQQQMLATHLSMVGEDEAARAAFGERPLPAGQEPGVTFRPAVEEIVRQARGKRLVMLNEAHHVPMHRAFATRLLTALRKEGFTTLACETFRPHPGRAVTLDMGFYTREPAFGELVRTAIRQGWELVAYETERFGPLGGGVRGRESDQASQLYRRALRDPRRRVFAYVGYSHLDERWGPGGRNGWMAARLRRWYGMDPLTVDQTEWVLAPGQESVIAFREGRAVVRGNLGPRRDQGAGADLQVRHPNLSRAEWMRWQNRSPRRFAAEPVPRRRLVEAFRPEDGPRAVATDRALIPPGADGATLFLPAGEFRFAVSEE